MLKEILNEAAGWLPSVLLVVYCVFLAFRFLDDSAGDGDLLGEPDGKGRNTRGKGLNVAFRHVSPGRKPRGRDGQNEQPDTFILFCGCQENRGAPGRTGQDKGCVTCCSLT